MRIYVGQTRSRDFIRLLTEHGIGECTNRGEFPPRRTPWFLDNGAFSDWTSGQPWDESAWLADVAKAELHSTSPDFCVAPDLVGQGVESLAHSVRWLPRLSGLKPYLAVQDGQSEEGVRSAATSFAGLFVGGTLEWKLATAHRWVDLAHSLGLPCHVGRVGNPQRLRWAREIGADSVDSSQPLWCRKYLLAFLRVAAEKQATFWSLA